MDLISLCYSDYLPDDRSSALRDPLATPWQRYIGNLLPFPLQWRADGRWLSLAFCSRHGPYSGCLLGKDLALERTTCEFVKDFHSRLKNVPTSSTSLSICAKASTERASRQHFRRRFNPGIFYLLAGCKCWGASCEIVWRWSPEWATVVAWCTEIVWS